LFISSINIEKYGEQNPVTYPGGSLAAETSYYEYMNLSEGLSLISDSFGKLIN